ncbi:MAG: LLM class flavin-dependent oxidoreductase [Oscillospiraceae bacterium]
MSEVVDVLSTDYGWSDSLSNFSAKLGRGSLRYAEAVKIADILGYDIVWQKRR